MRKPCAHHWIIADYPDEAGNYRARCRKCRKATSFAGRLPANLWRRTYREKVVADPPDAVDCGEEGNDWEVRHDRNSTGTGTGRAH